jgi:ABC-type branched-subunit amino acid transport system substrate-binding protein
MRTKALVLLLALTSTACAGEVGQYRSPPSAATAPSAPAAGIESGTNAAPALEIAAPSGLAEGATTGGSTVAAGRPGRAATTSASGPAARVASGNGTGQPASASGDPTTPVAGQARRPSATANGTASGPSSPSPPSGGEGVAPLPPSRSTGTGTTIGVTKDTVTIGLFYPKTGPYAGLLRHAPAVVQGAFDEAGPINGRRVDLKTYDDGTANASTIQVEEKRARNESFALISGVSESNVVLAPLADQHGIPTIVANIDEQVALPLTHVFAVTAYIRRQAVMLPQFIKNELGAGGKRIGIVYEGTSTAKHAKDAFKAKATELGLNVVFEQPIAQNQSTCANEVANLQTRRVEVAFMMNGPLGAICMLRDARAMNYLPTWTGVGASWNFNVVATASGGTADGIRTLATSTTLETPAGRRFVAFARRYLPNSGVEDDDIMLVVYGFTQTVIEALRRTGPNLTREAFVQTFETHMNDFDAGFLPPPTFGPGNRSGPVVVGVTACCTSGKWTSPQPGWRASF